ncbi:MAG: DinB family protein [Gemmatales bacterium]|nr:DinB family protein [Gemmatales bacterium]MCS7159026.1 DinB family protein [Gemmatales bacterium]MDW8174226.1 DinB family protein [Gemmatales bacterium]MDW8223457.1 DinB family protein [Gemmatales bacterium]
MNLSATAGTLLATVKSELIAYFRHLGQRVERHAYAVPESQFWEKPFAFGNSLGHLILHLTGNLNYYVGSGIAGTGYVRNRTREFTDPTRYPREQVLQHFREAIDLVVHTIEGMDEAAMLRQVTFPDKHPINTQFGLLLVCAAHLNNHIGQMAWLVQALGKHTGEPPVW